MFLKPAHIRCHQEKYQSGMVYQTNVLKIPGKKKEAKRHIDALNFSKGTVKEKGTFDCSFLHLHKIFYILQAPGLIQTAKWSLKS